MAAFGKTAAVKCQTKGDKRTIRSFFLGFTVSGQPVATTLTFKTGAGQIIQRYSLPQREYIPFLLVQILFNGGFLF